SEPISNRIMCRHVPETFAPPWPTSPPRPVTSVTSPPHLSRKVCAKPSPGCAPP
ncbi:uncharacterized protein METZ01_LOCUS477096, partial [marine metagenome]